MIIVNKKSCIQEKADGIAFVVNGLGHFLSGEQSVAKLWPDVKMLLNNIALAGHLSDMIYVKYDQTHLFALRDYALKDDIQEMVKQSERINCTTINVAVDNIESEQQSIFDQATETCEIDFRFYDS